MYVVPSGAPQNVRTLALELPASSMTVVWEPPLLGKRNGIITSYMIKYSIGDKLVKVIVVKDIRQIRLANLEPLTNYSVEVAAATRKGYGPFSQPVIHETHPPGKYLS